MVNAQFAGVYYKQFAVTYFPPTLSVGCHGDGRTQSFTIRLNWLSQSLVWDQYILSFMPNLAERKP
jgi:hypothetical protein